MDEKEYRINYTLDNDLTVADFIRNQSSGQDVVFVVIANDDRWRGVAIDRSHFSAGDYEVFGKVIRDIDSWIASDIKDEVDP